MLLRWFVVVLILIAGCKKVTIIQKFDRYGYVDTAARITLIADNINPTSDTTGNFLQTIFFDRSTFMRQSDTLYEQFTTIDMYRQGDWYGVKRRFRVVYVGGTNLIDADSGRVDSGYLSVDFVINKRLLGKPIFEVYDRSNNRLYSKVVASHRPSRIHVWYRKIGTETIEDVINACEYYVQKIGMDTVQYYSYN